MSDAKKAKSKIRENIQAQMDQREEEHRRELFRKRIDLAKGGLAAYEQRKISDAVQNFRTYIKILEEYKKVPDGGLQPSLFSMKEDLPELLLISGVYWDLAKIYDRTQSEAKLNEFRHYLNKFVIFSRGMPYQPLCAETLRKYIAHEKPVHKTDFRAAHKRLATGKCFVATALVDVCEPETLPRLRGFRDRVLMRSIGGRAFVRWYYRNGPLLAEWTDRRAPAVRRGFGYLLDVLARVLGSGYQTGSSSKPSRCGPAGMRTRSRRVRPNRG